MKPKKFWLLVSLFAVHVAKAQEPFDLKKCIEYGLSRSETLKNAKLDIEIAQATVDEVKSQGLPQVSATAGLINNTIIQKLILPAQLAGGRPGDPPVAMPFGVNYTSALNLQYNQLIFDGTFFLGLQAARVYEELSFKSFKATQIQIVENITKAYYGALVTSEQSKQLKGTLARLDSLLADTRAMYQNGFVEEIDVQRIEVQRNNLQTQLFNLERVERLSLELLRFQMGMPKEEELVIDQSIRDLSKENFQTQANSDGSSRIELSLLSTQSKLDSFNIQRYRVGYLPTLYGFGTFGANAGGNRVSNFKYFEYSTLGLQLNVPIFDGFYKRSKIQQALFAKEKTANNTSQLRHSIALEIAQTETNLKNAVMTLENESRNIDLAKKVYAVTKIKYQSGVGSLLELTSASGDLSNAETNYFVALYNALIAKTNYLKAIGQLNP
jgi:outer membrane protein TolC